MEREATFRQNQCIGGFLGLKVWECVPKLGFDEAKEIVSSIKDGTVIKDQLAALIVSRGNPPVWGKKQKLTNGKTPTKKPKQDWQALYDKAHAAGMKAGLAKVPVPMQVVQRANPLDDSSPIVHAYEPCLGGVCGFAGIKFPGNTSWGKWCNKQGLARPGYPTGLHISCHEFGQSYEKKCAYAGAFAEVLREAGIERVYMDSRLD